MEPSSMCRLLVMFIIIFTINICFASTAPFNLEDIVRELQEQVKELQKGRQEDSETIRKLHENIHRYMTEEEPFDFLNSKESLSRMSEESWKNAEHLSPDLTNLGVKNSELNQLGKELKHLKSQLVLAVESDENHGSNIKSEIAFFRQEILQLRKMVEEVDARRKDESHASSDKIAIRWLQRTVEDLRHEMKEMASSLNTSAALADKQRTETKLDLLKSDVSSLGHRMDSVRVDRERNAALIQQLRQDVDELRTRLQEFASEHRKITVELDSLKEEFREQSFYSQRKNPSSITERVESEKEIRTRNGHDGKTHSKFRHGHWKAQVDNLHEIVDNLEQQQSELAEELKVVRKNQVISLLKLDAVEKTCFNLLNKSEPLELEQRVTNQRVEILEGIVNKTERQTLDIQSRVNNITSSGIKKLHGSTMQLFEALERLESNHDRTTADIRREMSKLDYNLSQTQSDLEELRDRQIAIDEIMSSVKTEVETAQSETRRNHLRILLVQSSVLNKTLQTSQYNNGIAMQDAKISALETQIQSLSQDVDTEKTEIEALHRQMMEKANEQDLSRWEKIQRKVRESILEFKEDVPRIKKRQEKIEQQLEMFAEELPKDCSLNSALEQMARNKSGIYLIHPGDRNLHTPAVKVFCDMENSGGQWIVIQRRSKGDHSFEQDWKHYKEGFGDMASGDFWLGNDLIHKITTSNDYALRIDLWDSLGKYTYAEYSTFRVLGETDNYRLVIDGYKGNASDAMEYHNGMSFSTPDEDNDASSATHCGRLYGSGWWYNHCQFVNINGRFNTGITWYNIKEQEWSELTRVEMKIKRRKLLFN